ncbi:phosphatase PAP2 family protein [Cryptosporangium sp. NPDC051539]|uniref:phosphatase PAP2 family protein n=1 Tax=Cryptosporangium sp. NPDC051539 TaxID=3363962 RepID=UPI00379D23FC
MWLSWRAAVWLSIGLAVLATIMRVYVPSRRWLWVRDLAQESAISLVLYAVWQLVGRLNLGGNSQAVAHGLAIVNFERTVHLPSEEWTQHLAMQSHLLIKAANWYYIAGHMPVMTIFLVWLYLWHRPDFARWRTVLAVGTIVGELVQVIPVAPPRLALSSIVDTLSLYGPRVYADDGAGFAPQLGAMPSLHCVWAITTGAAVFCVAKSRWRWIGPAHAVVTVLVVVVTGNHYWSDALAAGLLVLLGVAAADTFAQLSRRRHEAGDPSADQIDVRGPAKSLGDTIDGGRPGSLNAFGSVDSQGGD